MYINGGYQVLYHTIFQRFSRVNPHRIELKNMDSEQVLISEMNSKKKNNTKKRSFEEMKENCEINNSSKKDIKMKKMNNEEADHEVKTGSNSNLQTGEDVCGHGIINDEPYLASKLAVSNVQESVSQSVDEVLHHDVEEEEEEEEEGEFCNKINITKIIHQSVIFLSPARNFEVKIERQVSEAKPFPAIIIRRSIYDNIKKQLFLFPNEFSKVCDVLKKITADPDMKTHSFDIELTGSENRVNRNCIKVNIHRDETEVDGDKLTDIRVDIRYWFRKSINDGWLPTLSGVRLPLSHIYRLVNMEETILDRCKLMSKINNNYNSLCNILIKYFLLSDICEAEGSRITNVKKFISQTDMSQFHNMLICESKYSVKINEFLNQYDVNELFNFIQSNTGINILLSCLSPQF